MRHFRLAVIFLPVALAACQSTILPDDKIKSETARVLNVAPDQVTISNRSSEGISDTSYIASASGRTYSCTINGGTVLSFGMSNTPVCTAR